ncbi:hypothetical protein A9Q89_05315 [Gammaproteobacteria bacterium 53_120_T64]|nr:hypothetical protein A9Q89_05315 [Gammaproteobacteria bacterium 53_120_T64]
MDLEKKGLKKRSQVFDAPTRLSAAIKNGSAIARFGRLQARTGTVYYIAHEGENYRLRCYEIKKSDSKRIPIIIVPPLMISAEVFDVDPESSAVAYLTAQGYSVWIVDFGAPERQVGGLERNFSDHILAVNDAIDYVYEQKKVPVHLAGYCQGGIFCYLAAAYRHSNDVASIITFGAPVNIYKNFFPGVPDEVTTRVFENIGKVIPKSLTPSVIPAWATKNLFKLLSPTKEVKRWISFLGSLHDRDALLQTEEGRSFLGGEGFVAWPGPALYEFLQQMLIGNRLVSGGCVIEARAISLTEITCPILAVIGSKDEIARAPSVRGIADAVPNAELYELYAQGGHMGIVIGSGARKNVWPAVAQWVQWREGKGEQPEAIDLLGEQDNTPPQDSKRDTLPTTIANTLFGMGQGALATAGDLLGITKDSVQAISSNFSTHLSHFTRLEKLNSDSKVGLALSLQEQATKAPQDTFFLYDGIAHSYADASKRVDNIVRGLISIGIRAGDHVGIYMYARPSSLATIMAVNRLGAVVVLLRTMPSKGQLAIELRLGKVQHLIADPENAAAAATSFPGQVYVLGGIGQLERDLPNQVIDLESIDPACVALPDWYQASPGKASDIAFVMFSKRGDDTHCFSITNQRWALTALGTASSTAIRRSDTSYCWTPLHDATGLVVAVSASLVAGARVALAKEFDIATFWKEARGYGARIVFYSGCMLRELVDAPIHKLEKGHSIRLFAGVGMPEALSKRVGARLKPAKIMEIFIVRGSNAYLANISCQKTGPVFQAIPGCSEIALVYWNYEKNLPFLDAAGYLCPVPDGVMGMLLSKSENCAEYLGEQTIYNVFSKGDCWQVSGDLFQVDSDGEYRFLDRCKNLIRVKDDYLATTIIESGLWQLESTSLAAAYGLRIEGYDYDLPAVALQLRSDAKLSAKQLSTVVAQELDPKTRPLVVRVVDNIPMTLGHQADKSILKSEGLPPSALQRGKSFWLNPQTDQYEALNKTSLNKLKKALGIDNTTDKNVGKPSSIKVKKTANSTKSDRSISKKTAANKSPTEINEVLPAQKENGTTEDMTLLSGKNVVAINEANGPSKIIIEATKENEITAPDWQESQISEHSRGPLKDIETQ